MSEQLIEEQIKAELSGDMQKNALDFAAFLQANDFSPKRNDEDDAWNIFYKETNIVFVKITREKNELAIVLNSCDFDGGNPADNDLKEFAWSWVVFCPQGCGAPTICEMSQKHFMIFGREYENVCVAPLEFFNLDAHELNKAQTLMLMLMQNRADA